MVHSRLKSNSQIIGSDLHLSVEFSPVRNEESLCHIQDESVSGLTTFAKETGLLKEYKDNQLSQVSHHKNTIQVQSYSVFDKPSIVNA